ncbi:MAG: AAA family ATPase [Haliscomenobacter sp.]|uniref:AAA family ATPase n=1 Tax=Haliscomenobacter sp. TaxID=2717303 RepID=UPI0029BA1326|nr:AAA family ATPase [Haliscomenobacter sp.]MDX2069728.1 AAA family ATPase [Haliscomenobacter sp.]
MQAILFIGIQATGKTTFYLNNFFRTHVHISLDQLNTRNKEAQFIDTCLSTQQAFVVDNTNPTRAERKGYIDKAKSRHFRVIAYYFQSSLEQALRWNAQREGKARIPEIGIKGTYRKLELPTLDEGFDELYYVAYEDNEWQVKTWNNEI